MALIFYLGVNDGKDIKREASFILKHKFNSSSEFSKYS